jgi:hypothetical protein
MSRVVALVILASACETTTESGKMTSGPAPSEFLLPKPEANFRLSGAELRDLPAGMDHDAVQEFLAWVAPARRAQAIALLQEVGQSGNSVPIITVDASRPELGEIMRRIWKRPDSTLRDSTTLRRNES